ncbi:glycosyltransferase family 25 protein [Thioclava electrotropha]|uniref:Glycosyl transferase family 25 domain-containing protein n=1 Tax=Thioclava electrotropha TaxID=1549850 RepID=A0ABX6YNS2_9RHOB|nr:glycosyltransferase family 25 protein [Thioclava electrotropha]QPZ89471.1 hypothetical protein AKL02_000340 [Thioclava electrotropha]
MNILYINLDAAAARRAWMENQFSELGIKAHRVSAVTSGNLSEKASGITFGSDIGRKWFDAEKACLLSHRECWKRIAEGADEFGAIFEDDVHLSSDAADFLTDAAWIPSGLDVVKIETYLQKVWTDKRRIRVRGRSLHRLKSNHFGSAGYILNRDAAAKLLKHSTHVEMPSDHLVFNPAYNFGLRVWQLSEAICIQDDRLNAKEALFPSQISSSADRVGIHREKPKSVGKKIIRELSRIYEQARVLAANPIRPIRMQRTIIEYRGDKCS